jgi:tetratricopeptide (TPR) repeat protein
MNAGDLAQAREHFEEAQKIRQRALAGDQANAKLRRDLGQGFYNLGDLARQDGREADMEANLTQAIGIFEKLNAEQPGDLDNQNLLARTYRVLCHLWSITQKDKARELYQRAIALLEPLARHNPEVVDYQIERAGLLFELSLLESDATNSAAARQALEQAKGILQPLALRFPENARCQRDLGMTLRDLALEQDAAGDSKSAADNLRDSIRILSELALRFPDNPDYAEQLKSAQDVALGKPNETPPEEQASPK